MITIIKKLRQKKGCSQTELANLIKVSRPVLADIEKECIDLMNDLGLTLKDYESEVRKKSTEYFRTKV